MGLLNSTKIAICLVYLILLRYFCCSYSTTTAAVLPDKLRALNVGAVGWDDAVVVPKKTVYIADKVKNNDNGIAK